MQEYLYKLAGIDPRQLTNADDIQLTWQFREAEEIGREYARYVRSYQAHRALPDDTPLILHPPRPNDPSASRRLQKLVETVDELLLQVDQDLLTVPRVIPAGVHRLQMETGAGDGRRVASRWRPDDARTRTERIWNAIEWARQLTREPLQARNIDDALHAYVGVIEAGRTMTLAIDGDPDAIRALSGISAGSTTNVERAEELEAKIEEYPPVEMPIVVVGNRELNVRQSSAILGGGAAPLGVIALPGSAPGIVVLIALIAGGVIGWREGTKYEARLRKEGDRRAAIRRPLKAELAEVENAIELDQERFVELQGEAVALAEGIEGQVLTALLTTEIDAQQQDRLQAAVLELREPPAHPAARRAYARLVTQSEIAHAEGRAMPGRFFVPTPEQSTLHEYRTALDRLARGDVINLDRIARPGDDGTIPFGRGSIL